MSGGISFGPVFDFKLQFDPTLISGLANEYLKDEKRAVSDQELLAAGARILNGDYSEKNLEVIFKWKSPRVVPHLHKNSGSRIRKVLSASVAAKNPRDAIDALVWSKASNIGLQGVQHPMASSILTAIFPNKFTVIDYKALASLGCEKYSLNTTFYLDYLVKCIEIAKEAKTDLRTVDRALWQWWYNQEKAARGSVKKG